MLILTAVILVLIPAIAILYPFLRGMGDDEIPEYEESPDVPLSIRWDAALSGLKSAELDWAVGRSAEEDYRHLRELYMAEAALVMKEMELDESEERELMASIEREREESQARSPAIGDGAAPAHPPISEGKSVDAD